MSSSSAKIVKHVRFSTMVMTFIHFISFCYNMSLFTHQALLIVDICEVILKSYPIICIVEFRQCAKRRL